MTDIEVIHRADAEVGEGPTWDARTQELHWVDILQGMIYTDRLDGSAPSSVQLDTHVGAVLPAANAGEWLVCARAGFMRYDRATGEATPLALPLDARPELRFNDAKVAPGGRAFGDTMPYETDAAPGALYRLDGLNQATEVVSSLRLGNGLGWSPDARTMYFIDSGAQVVWSADYDEGSGSVGSARSLIEFALPEGSLPDGMCVDDDGCLWVAIMGGGRLERYTPTGVLDRTIELPVKRPTSACFAGPKLDSLIVPSLSYQLSDEQRREDPLAGSLLRIDIGCTGPAATPWDPTLIGLSA